MNCLGFSFGKSLCRHGHILESYQKRVNRYLSDPFLFPPEREIIVAMSSLLSSLSKILSSTKEAIRVGEPAASICSRVLRFRTASTISAALKSAQEALFLAWKGLDEEVLLKMGLIIHSPGRGRCFFLFFGNIGYQPFGG